MTDQDDYDEKRTEGVRIIGAQEAAEAAGRPDVVRRRRRSEKRFGDRPDKPEVDSDLPKIRISTTETDRTRGDDRGSAPLVRPGSAGPEPDWADPNWSDSDPDDAETSEELRTYGPIDDDGERINVGHARIIPAETTGDDTEMSYDDGADSDPIADADDDLYGSRGRAEDDLYRSGGGADDDFYGTSSGPAGSGAFGGDDPYSSRSSLGDWGEGDATEAWDESPAYGSTSAAGTPGAGTSGAGTSGAGMSGDQDANDDWAREQPAVEYSDDDSFVLPHWTEPPTGQVPKVVIGDAGGEPTGSVDYVSQPRWRGEGERSSATDFGDLLDDGPRLGALGGEADEDYADNDFFAPEHFGSGSADDAEYDDYVDDGYEDDYDDDLDDDRQRPRPERRGDGELGSSAGSGGGERNLVTAALVGVGLVVLGLVCFKLGAFTTALLVTAVLTYAAVEFFTAVREAGYNTATLLGVPAVAGVVFATYTSGLEAYPVVIGLTILAGLLWYLWVAPGERAVVNLGVTLLGVLWIGFLGSFATLFLGIGRDLMDLQPSLKSNPGIGVLIAAVIVAVSHDVGAYFIGRQFGSTPLSMASPNKTQEGLIGGVLTAFVVNVLGVGVGKINPIGDSLSRTVIFAVLCSLVAPLGDLCESAIKRDLKVKDMGSLLPGHGGVLDRFDALLFVLPTAYFLTTLLGVWTLTP
ncbi:MAG: phosphatidate cytidylyltransferase [Microthrixaceae bacterium]